MSSSPGWLQLKFEDKGAGLVAGCAWIVHGQTEIVPDCATIGELEHRVMEIKNDLDKIVREARREFYRCQGGSRD